MKHVRLTVSIQGWGSREVTSVLLGKELLKKCGKTLNTMMST